jgi:hypothetical protein
MANQVQATEQVQETTAQATEQVQTTKDQAGQQDLSIQEQIQKAIEASISPLKSEIAGLNRKNTELEKEKRDAEIKKLPEKEQWQAKLDALTQRENDLTAKEQKVAREGIVRRMADKYNLTKKLADRLIGKDEAEIEADAKYLSDFVAQEVQTKATDTVNEKLSGKPPVGGKTTVLTDLQKLDQEHKKAVSTGDMDKANAIFLASLELKKE